MELSNLLGSFKFTDLTQWISGLASNGLVLWILGLATMVGVLDANGFLPNSIAKWLARNRLENTLNALKKLDVRVCWDDEKRSITLTDRFLDSIGVKELAYKVELRRLLNEDTFKGSMEIGDTTIFNQDQFIDVMGATTDSLRAIRYAKLLQTHLKNVDIPSFDIVATPRTGSPILGYEFSRLSRKPFVMGVYEKVHDRDGAMGGHSSLDFPKTLELSGKTVLIVDDSTTGGRKQVTLANKLRASGAIVKSSLVLFEPQGKGAREALSKENISLYAVQSGPSGNF